MTNLPAKSDHGGSWEDSLVGGGLGLDCEGKFNVQLFLSGVGYEGEIIKELLADHETIVTDLRKNIDESTTKNKDLGTADFLTGLMEQHETLAWVLRRYLD